MRVFVVKAFRRFQRKEKIDDDALREAIARVERGSVDADLGGGLIKQRVARKGQGQSGGYRTIIAYREGDRSVFLKGFAKSGQANIDAGDKKLLTRQAKVLMNMTIEAIEDWCDDEELVELEYGD